MKVKELQRMLLDISDEMEVVIMDLSKEEYDEVAYVPSFEILDVDVFFNDRKEVADTEEFLCLQFNSEPENYATFITEEFRKLHRATNL